MLDAWIAKNHAALLNPSSRISRLTSHSYYGVKVEYLDFRVQGFLCNQRLRGMTEKADIKPAEDTPLSTYNLVQILIESGLPSGVVNVVNGMGPEAGGPLHALGQSRLCNAR